MGNFDDFIQSVYMFHIQKCGKSNCRTCNFICNLRYVYMENVFSGTSCVENLQNYCRQNYDFFYLICSFLCPIANIEKEKIKLEIKLKETIELWSANTAQK